MYIHHKLGKPLHSFEKGVAPWLHGLLFLLAGLAMVGLTVFAVLTLFNLDLLPFAVATGFRRVLHFLGVLLIGWLAYDVLYHAWRLNPMQISAAEIYENGITITQGEHTHAIELDQIKGILALSTFTVVLSNPPGALDLPFVSSVGNRYRSVTIAEKQGGEPFIVRVPNFVKFARMLNAKFTQYIMKELTPENISRAAISFGEHLQLTGGQFVYDPPDGASRVYLPLGQVTGIEFNAEGWSILAIRTKNPDDQLRIPHRQTRTMLNIDILHQIILRFCPKEVT